jgi:hypothetical protein
MFNQSLLLLSAFLLVLIGGLACKGVDPSDPGTTSTTDIPTTADAPTGSSGETPTTSASTAGTTDDPATTTLETTSTDPATTDAETSSTGTIAGCGDGEVDPGEECDEGLSGNDDNLYCTEDCTLNICGDGKLFIGWELCDEGLANNDEYGVGLCTTQCTPSERCGDHKVQPEYETCDLGPDNGGPNGDDQGILCGPTCRAQQLRGFVTGGAFTGNLGGFFGADLKCSAAAGAAGLPEPERFHALLSSGDVGAAKRFEAVSTSLPYVLITGKKFADNFPTLITTGPLGEGIVVTETGATLHNVKVATNTAPGGAPYSPDQHCQGWTTADPAFTARVGINGMPTDTEEWDPWHDQQQWLGIKDLLCDKVLLHLYCLEI